MHPRTIETLKDLQQAQWFSCVGITDTDAAVVLTSWYEAIQTCSSPEWQDMILEASNRYCEKLAENSQKRFQKWNEIVISLRPVTRTLVEEKTKKVIQENDLPKIFLDTVNWDILHLCMEAEYADVYPPGFFASQAYWYVKGHFPCGWQGKFPEGKLIIY